MRHRQPDMLAPEGPLLQLSARFPLSSFPSAASLKQESPPAARALSKGTGRRDSGRAPTLTVGKGCRRCRGGHHSLSSAHNRGRVIRRTEAGRNSLSCPIPPY